jgi:hypothetical protein
MFDGGEHGFYKPLTWLRQVCSLGLLAQLFSSCARRGFQTVETAEVMIWALLLIVKSFLVCTYFYGEG